MRAFRRLVEAIEAEGSAALVTLARVEGSSPREAGTRMVVRPSGGFNGTVGGTRAPGATGFEDLKTSIMDKLITLPPETRIHPGHREPSTIGTEWENNPFVRIWRGLDPEGSSPCSIGPADAEEREAATLILWAPDYDGGNKAWVRFEDGTDAIVGGSQVKRDQRVSP